MGIIIIIIRQLIRRRNMSIKSLYKGAVQHTLLKIRLIIEMNEKTDGDGKNKLSRAAIRAPSATRDIQSPSPWFYSARPTERALALYTITVERESCV